LHLAGDHAVVPSNVSTSLDHRVLGRWGWKPELAVAVTAAHVLISRIDFVGQPRWIVLASRPSDVKIDKRTGPLGFGSGLIVGGRNGQWTIPGQPGAFNPKSVLDAWWQAANATAKTA